MRSHRRVGRGGRWLVVLGTLVLLAPACITGGGGGGDPTEGGNGNGNGTPSPGQTEPQIEPRVAQEPTEPVELTFMSWVGESPQIKGLARDFNKLHPNITIKFQNVPAGRARDKLLTQVAGGNPPDTAYVDSGVVEEFAQRNALFNLDEFIAGSEVVAEEDYVEGFMAGMKFQDSIYGLPFDGETTGLFYRTDLFEAAGIDGPPETWEEFEAAAQALTDPDKRQYGFAIFAPEAAYYWFPWLWQAGGELIAEDGQDILFDNEEGKRAAEFYVGLREYSPPDQLSSNSWDARVAFATGKVGMYMAGSWLAGELLSSFPDTEGLWATAGLPEGPAGCATTLAGDALVVLDDIPAEKQDAAWLWIEFLSRPENMKLWTYGEPTTTLLPPRKSLLADPELAEKKPFLVGFAEAMECAVVSNIEQPKWSEVEAKLNEYLGQAIFGDITAIEAVEQAAAEGAEIIAG